MIVTILKKYVWVLNLLLLSALAYVLATVVNSSIEGELSSSTAVASQQNSSNNPVKRSSRRQPLNYYEVIVQRNLFGVTNVGSNESTVGSSENIPESNLDLELLGTIVNRDAPSIAIIKNLSNSKVDGFRGGQIINIIENENVRLVRVENCKAVIERVGKGPETIKCLNLKNQTEVASTKTTIPTKRVNRPRPKNDAKSQGSTLDRGIQKVDEGQYVIDRDMLEEVLGDPTTILNQARVIPQDDGLRFFGIRPNTVFHKIGIRNGDIMNHINGVELSDVERALGLFEELRSQSNFTIDFTRAGQKYTYEYNVR